ncbi:MAG: magnesium transporter CorA family protein [Alphaproteobacteria bacterium]|nr:magnesium transporter CorA family protein [Alphaproteobacteria bacterium]
MARIYSATTNTFREFTLGTDSIELQAGDVWLDLLNPTPEEEKAFENVLGIELPMREEMRSIEPSSRLYRENDALYMTATVVAGADTPDSAAVPMAFILHNRLFITIRYHEPRSIVVFSKHLLRHPEDYQTGPMIFGGLMEAIVERAAEVLEYINAEADKISHIIFTDTADRPAQDIDSHAEILKRIARLQNLMAKMRDSLTTMGRVMHFSPLHEIALRDESNLEDQLRSIDRDITSLGDQAGFISNSIGFLLNASLGLINIEQNGIIKFFSVVAVVFLPPTLIASIYGMNFGFMPELHWHLGYPIALCLMFLSAVGPYMWFKFKRWL